MDALVEVDYIMSMVFIVCYIVKYICIINVCDCKICSIKVMEKDAIIVTYSKTMQ